MLQTVINAGYVVLPANEDPANTSVIEIPVKIDGVRPLRDVSMWEQTSLAAFMQEYWADNQVSCTVTFKPEEGKDIKQVLNYFQYKLKAISFLPKLEYGIYPQMPYEEISNEIYNKLIQPIKPIVFNNISEDSKVELFCTNDTCTIIKK